MIHEYNLRVLPPIAADERVLIDYVSKEYGLNPASIKAVQILKRSIDARQKIVYVNLSIRVFENEPAPQTNYCIAEYGDVSQSKSVIVVGAGPAGLFAALRLIELGFKPIVLERGKNVSTRKRDIALISREQIVDPESNYCFGEGGAGAYSDGKLYTRSKKKGNNERILKIFCMHGANPNILVDVHPHIGTDKLPDVIRKIRERIIQSGGEVHFETKVVDLIIDKDSVKGVIVANGDEYHGPIIMATGHSARDVYAFLDKRGVMMESKGIAVGVRLEHPQIIIDQIQYHNIQGRGLYLPPAEYNFVTQIQNRGVYSFCMCPGGFVVPAASGPQQVVVNGMSPSNRGSKWANSGMVVEIRPEDLPEYAKYGIFSVMRFQEDLEKKAWLSGGSTQVAPAQRMTDFIHKKESSTLPDTSYVPGLKSTQLNTVIPKFVDARLRDGLVTFGKWSSNFLTKEASMIGVETRTSAPIRVLRDTETLAHVQIKGLYPCGEGAGYAGGIVSAAIDGERCAEMCAATTL
ncbi:MAG: FAD-binding protein [Bacteroidia bacterium]|nr:FAD-binding protein [Bacteroidia bacterium]